MVGKSTFLRRMFAASQKRKIIWNERQSVWNERQSVRNERRHSMGRSSPNEVKSRIISLLSEREFRHAASSPYSTAQEFQIITCRINLKISVLPKPPSQYFTFMPRKYHNLASNLMFHQFAVKSFLLLEFISWILSAQSCYHPGL